MPKYELRIYHRRRDTHLHDLSNAIPLDAASDQEGIAAGVDHLQRTAGIACDLAVLIGPDNRKAWKLFERE